MGIDLGLHLPMLVDGVIAIAALEGAALFVHHRLTGGGVRPRVYLLNLVSGVCLMLALRCALRNEDAVWIAWWLSCAGLSHGADIRLRWKRRRNQPTVVIARVPSGDAPSDA